MGKVVKLRDVRRERANGKTLCTSGFHKWTITGERHFDVHEGKLVTAERCERCGKTRTRLS